MPIYQETARLQTPQEPKDLTTALLQVCLQLEGFHREMTRGDITLCREATGRVAGLSLKQHPRTLVAYGLTEDRREVKAASLVPTSSLVILISLHASMAHSPEAQILDSPSRGTTELGN